MSVLWERAADDDEDCRVVSGREQDGEVARRSLRASHAMDNRVSVESPCAPPRAASGRDEVTDLEMTILCAEAMGYDVYLVSDFAGRERWMLRVNSQTYEPITDNAEAMALVKRLRLWIQAQEGFWHVHTSDDVADYANSPDLNRAIVECVAKMKKATP